MTPDQRAAIEALRAKRLESVVAWRVAEDLDGPKRDEKNEIAEQYAEDIDHEWLDLVRSAQPWILDALDVADRARRDLVWSAAYGAAFSAELRRLGHGEDCGRWEGVPGTTTGSRYIAEPTDARAYAKAWAKTCADLAVASLDEEPAT